MIVVWAFVGGCVVTVCFGVWLCGFSVWGCFVDSCGVFTIHTRLLWLIVLLALFYILCCRFLLDRIVYLFSWWFGLLCFVILVYWLLVDLRLRFTGL